MNDENFIVFEFVASGRSSANRDGGYGEAFGVGKAPLCELCVIGSQFQLRDNPHRKLLEFRCPKATARHMARKHQPEPSYTSRPPPDPSKAPRDPVHRADEDTKKGREIRLRGESALTRACVPQLLRAAPLAALG